MSGLKSVNCPRCGKETLTAMRSLTGNDGLKKRYEGVCSNCMTDDEKEEIMKAQTKSMLDMARRRVE